MTTYRRPKAYVPPYNYCDRWCSRCAIDKSRCLVYQTEMDDRLHREIDGKGEPTMDESIERMSADLGRAIELVREQAKEMGVDLDGAAKAAPAPPPEPGPALRDGEAIARATMAFLRQHGKEIPEEAEVLRWMCTLVGPKLARARSAGPDGDETAEADAILQAQIVHRAVERMLGAFEAAARKRPGILDPYLELLELLRRVRKEVEAGRLSKPSALLEPYEGAEWWGPLRDVTPTLKNLRR